MTSPLVLSSVESKQVRLSEVERGNLISSAGSKDPVWRVTKVRTAPLHLLMAAYPHVRVYPEHDPKNTSVESWYVQYEDLRPYPSSKIHEEIYTRDEKINVYDFVIHEQPGVEDLW